MKLVKIAFYIIPFFLFVSLSFYEMGDSISYYKGVGEALKLNQSNLKLRVGGYIEPGSVKNSGSEFSFKVSDEKKNQIQVVYKGFLPPMFSEGRGIIAEGSFNNNCVFVAKELLAKHDEKYYPIKYVK